MQSLNLKRLLTTTLLVVLGACAQACAATGDTHPSPANRGRALAAVTAPRTVSGDRPLALLASGLHTPTAFAFGAGQVFESDYGATSGRPVGGGVYDLAHGRARRLPGSPAHVYGIAWHAGWLYMSTTTQLLRWGGFDGSRFTLHQVLFTAPPHFITFNGIGFGADGRLYAGTGTSFYDNGPVTSPLAREILTFNATGGDMQVFATGIRQPWQLAFSAHSNAPYVSDLGQDFNATNPPDFVLRARKGDNFGFWQCNWTAGSPCTGDTRPLIFLPPHYSPMGLTVVGKRLYINEFNTGTMVSVNLAGRDLRPEVRLFTASPLALAAHGGWIYVGQTNGTIWRYRPGG